MSKHTKILEIITEIRNSHSEMSNIFSKGSCLNFHIILKAIFSNAQAFYNSDHIITKIGIKYYDINGEVLNIENYIPFEDYFIEKKKQIVIKEMYNNEYKIEK